MQVVMCTRWITVGGGVEIQMLQMNRELARRGHRIELLFNLDGELGPEFRSFCHSTHQVPSFEISRKQVVRDLIRLIPAVRAAVGARPDVMYLNDTSQLPFGLLSGLVARTPVVCHLHSDYALRNGFSLRMLDRLSERASRLVACSAFIREQYIEAGVEPSKLTVVHNGIELESYPPASATQRAAARQALGLPEDVFVALFFGRLDAAKGVEVLLKAWRHLALPPDRARMLVVGSPALDPDPAGRLKELHALAPPGCHWLPARRDVVTPLHAADVVYVPSTEDERLARVVIEGLAAGLPVVASRVGGIPEVLNGDLAPFLFERASAVELADRLASLVNWRSDRPDLGERCHAHAAKRFGIGTMVDGIERILEEAVA